MAKTGRPLLSATPMVTRAGRLPEDLAAWVDAQGGWAFVRDVLQQWMDASLLAGDGWPIVVSFASAKKEGL